ncbi:MAG: DNA polymerase III subunit alpha [Cytophagales bacterium]|nr:DNA polymerase III subunit alpha [Cytophagales bacterium]
MYINCHSYFSFLYGTLSPQELFDEAQRHRVKKMVLTDINNTSAYIELLRICNENRGDYDLQIALGIEFREGAELLYIGIAANNRGFAALNRYLSRHNTEDLPLLSRAPEFDHVYIVYPFGKIDPAELRENEYIGIKIHEINRVSRSNCHNYQHKLVMLHPVSFKNKIGFNIHRLMRAIDQNIVLSKLDKRLEAAPDEVMMPEAELFARYRQYPQIISNTRDLLENCEISFEFGVPKNKKLFTESHEKDHAILRSLALEGFRQRYKTDRNHVMQRLLKELEVIANQRFEAYFLISHDVVEYAKRKNFAHVGRGSGANSMVAYCLGITEVDPIELDLYFERFLNPHRSSPPDFDIDFSWKDRDDVINHIIEKYSTEHTALLATHTTFQGKSIIRELGKVFGLPKNEIDKIVDHPSEMRNKDEITRLIFRYAGHLRDIPRNLSIHAGGILISEEPIYAYTATTIPPKGYPVTHFDMYGAEDIGLHKYDILSQRGLGHIKDAVEIIEQTKGIKIDITQTAKFKQDPFVNQLLMQGKCMGCFYIESPAMRMLLGKLECRDYITLVAASSIIRPGVARSGMMREYIYRHHNPNGFKYLHSMMGELMKETYGLMVYQEDVIKVAHHFAGLTLAEADILRRGMSGKFRSRKEFKRVEQKFFDQCKHQNYSESVYNEVWRQIESFSGYSFSKAHSACYAVESYQSLYLKAYHPLEFMVGVINNFGGFYHTEFYFHEARMSGANIESPCANTSNYLTRIIGKDIYVGFIHLKSLEQKIGKGIPIERDLNGPFQSMENFIHRIPLGLEQINILIRIGAFRFTGKSKRTLLWEARLLFGEKRETRHSMTIFEAPAGYRVPNLEKRKYEDAFDELELLGFPLCDPFSLLENGNFGNVKAAQLKERLNKQVEIVGYLVTTKNTRTKDHKLMHFGTFLDGEGMVFDTTHFPDMSKKYPFRGKGFYRLRGKVVEDFGYPMIEISSMKKEAMVHKFPEEHSRAGITDPRAV